MPTLLRKLHLEFVLVLVTLTLGLIHGWTGRYAMNPDGVSYLDVGESFFHRDWAHAVNGYWSPLYPWIVGVVVGIVNPSPKWTTWGGTDRARLCWSTLDENIVTAGASARLARVGN